MFSNNQFRSALKICIYKSYYSEWAGCIHILRNIYKLRYTYMSMYIQTHIYVTHIHTKICVITFKEEREQGEI